MILLSLDLTFNSVEYNKIKSINRNVNIIVVIKYIEDSENLKDFLLNKEITDLGINKTNYLLKKYEILKDYKIHFIGHLQKNKAKYVYDKIDYLHSLDSIELAKKLNKLLTKPLKCFIEINFESQKHGIKIEEIKDFIESLKEFKNIEIIGFMVMADINYSKDVFKIIKDYKNKYYPNYLLSMGMSNDYLKAIENETNYLRLGRVLIRR